MDTIEMQYKMSSQICEELIKRTGAQPVDVSSNTVNTQNL